MRKLNLTHKPKKEKQNKVETEVKAFWNLCNIINNKKLPPEAVEVKINMFLASHMTLSPRFQAQLFDLRDKNRERFNDE